MERPGPVLQAEFARMDRLMAEKEEQERLYRQKLQYFRFMMDAYEGYVYISDMDTYELLYVNQSSCDILGAPAAKVVGRQVLRGDPGENVPLPLLHQCQTDRG